MKFTFKEQMNWLTMNQVTYRNQWHYSNFIFQQGLNQESLTQKELQDIQGELRQAGILTRNHRVSFEETPQHYSYIQKLARQSFVIGDKVYPEEWNHIHQPPLLMYYLGHLDVLTKPRVSLVGTRQITDYGRIVTREMAKSLALAGIVTVSGLADGVDRFAHLGAMQTQDQSTIAVIATGVEKAYPSSHRSLQGKIAEKHLLLSEYLPTQTAQRHHFVMRNRLVAGLSPATLVMEAAHKSGSLITANYALQFNREVYALPGRITDTESVGCNALLEQGATPILRLSETVQSIQELHRYQRGEETKI